MPSAPMSIATTGVSLMPPGTAHISAVSISQFVSAEIQTAPMSIIAKHDMSIMLSGFTRWGIWNRSLRVSEHPTQLPASICITTRSVSGKVSGSRVQLVTANATNTPTSMPAGMRIKKSAHPNSTASAPCAHRVSSILSGIIMHTFLIILDNSR